MTVDSALLTGILGAVIGGGASLAATALSMRSQRKSEDSRLQHERRENRYADRRQTYGKFMTAMMNAVRQLDEFVDDEGTTPTTGFVESADRLNGPIQFALADLRLVAPPETYEPASRAVSTHLLATKEYDKSDRDARDRAINEFVEAAQRDLASTD